MTRSDSEKRGGKHAFPADADEARADIERAREELGDTVEALVHKVNVRERAKEQWHERTEPVREKAQHAAERAREVTPQPVMQSAETVAVAVRKRPAPILIGAGAAIVAGWLIAERRNR